MAIAAALNGDRVPYEHLAELYRAAKEQGYHTLSQLFFTGSTLDLPPAPLDRDEQRELTLGHRKSLARSMDRDVLLRLLRDPEAAVVRNLLENPG